MQLVVVHEAIQCRGFISNLFCFIISLWFARFIWCNSFRCLEEMNVDISHVSYSKEHSIQENYLLHSVLSVIGGNVGVWSTDNWPTQIIQNIHTLLSHEHKIWLTTALFWVVTQPVVVISERRFGKTYRSHHQRSTRLDSGSLKMGPVGCLETSVRKYHYWLRNSSEERSSDLSRGRSLRSRNPCDCSLLIICLLYTQPTLTICVNGSWLLFVLGSLMEHSALNHVLSHLRH